MKMLHGVIANPFHLKTLFDLMLSVSPSYQMKILRIMRTLLQTKLPLVVYDEAINASNSSLAAYIRKDISEMLLV